MLNNKSPDTEEGSTKRTKITPQLVNCFIGFGMYKVALTEKGGKGRAFPG